MSDFDLDILKKYLFIPLLVLCIPLLGGPTLQCRRHCEKHGAKVSSLFLFWCPRISSRDRCENSEMEFLDINLTKDSSLLLHSFWCGGGRLFTELWRGAKYSRALDTIWYKKKLNFISVYLAYDGPGLLPQDWLRDPLRRTFHKSCKSMALVGLDLAKFDRVSLYFFPLQLLRENPLMILITPKLR